MEKCRKLNTRCQINQIFKAKFCLPRLFIGRNSQARLVRSYGKLGSSNHSSNVTFEAWKGHQTVCMSAICDRHLVTNLVPITAQLFKKSAAKSKCVFVWLDRVKKVIWDLVSRIFYVIIVNKFSCFLFVANERVEELTDEGGYSIKKTAQSNVCGHSNNCVEARSACKGNLSVTPCDKQSKEWVLAPVEFVLVS